MSSSSEKKRGFFDGLFDLNGDGRTDTSEMALMFMMFDEMQKEEERNSQMPASTTYDLDEFDFDERTTDLDDLDIDGI